MPAREQNVAAGHRSFVASVSRQPMGNLADRLEARAEAGDRLAVPFELAVREVGDFEVGDATERRPPQLQADISER